MNEINHSAKLNWPAFLTEQRNLFFISMFARLAAAELLTNHCCLSTTSVRVDSFQLITVALVEVSECSFRTSIFSFSTWPHGA